MVALWQLHVPKYRSKRFLELVGDEDWWCYGSWTPTVSADILCNNGTLLVIWLFWWGLVRDVLNEFYSLQESFLIISWLLNLASRDPTTKTDPAICLHTHASYTSFMIHILQGLECVTWHRNHQFNLHIITSLRGLKGRHLSATTNL